MFVIRPPTAKQEVHGERGAIDYSSNRRPHGLPGRRVPRKTTTHYFAVGVAVGDTPQAGVGVIHPWSQRLNKPEPHSLDLTDSGRSPGCFLIVAPGMGGANAA